MYKFRASKYKNSVAKIAKKENWITDLSVESSSLQGSLIKSSAAFVAFHTIENGCDSLAVLPLEFKGKRPKNISCLHSGAVDKITDIDFSPFDDGLLATGSQECSVKLWNIPKEGFDARIANPEVILSDHEHKIENILFHPTVSHLLTTTNHSTLKLWDFSEQKETYCFSKQEDVIQSVSWKADGSTIVSSSKDKYLRIIDPRSSLVQEALGHENAKDSRVVWLGDSDRILSTGFDAGRHRELLIHDVRNFNHSLKTLMFDTSTGVLFPFFDSDTNMLFLVGKGDASIIFLEIMDSEPYVVEASKQFMEAPSRGACLVPKRAMNVIQAEVNRLLQLTPNAIVPISYQVPRKSYYDFHSDLFPDTDAAEPALSLPEWLSGITKKRKKISLDPAKRSASSLIKHREPSKDDERESFIINEEGGNDNQSNLQQESMTKDFQEILLTKDTDQITVDKNKIFDLDSSTAGNNTNLKHRNEKPFPLPKPSSSPLLRKKKSVETHSNKEFLLQRPKEPSATSVSPSSMHSNSQTVVHETNESALAEDGKLHSSKHVDLKTDEPEMMQIRKSSISEKEQINKSPQIFRKRDSSSLPQNQGDSAQKPNARRESAFKPFAGFRISKFRHLKGTPMHESQHIKNLSDFNTSLPGECDGIHANSKRIAVPLKGMGGRIAILELNKPGRLPDGIIPVLQNGANVMDFCWDPFDNQRIAVACDDGSIKIWTIPAEGLPVSKDKPDFVLLGHAEKINCLKFHPLAQDILVSSSQNFIVRIWDLKIKEEKLCLQGHKDKIFSMAWSPDGKYIATMCKDSKVRIFNPRMSSDPIQEGPGPVGSRGARIIWVLQGTHLVVSGFDRVSERLINYYNTENISVILSTLRLDTSPSILVPYYDEDSNTLFLTGKGDSTIYAYETLDEAPYLFPLSHHKCPNVHQGLALLPKIICNIRNVEFARVLRLVGNVLEPIAFTVPRVKMEFFQDDLFPDSRVSWEATMTSEEWFSGMNRVPKKISLMPDGMQPLTDKPSGQISTGDVASLGQKQQSLAEMTTKEKEQELAKALSSRIALETKLPQDSMEGVDPTEWDE